MDINKFLEIATSFFDMIHPNYNYDDDSIQENELDLWKICEDFFDQIGNQV
jgi:hypothetical protein